MNNHVNTHLTDEAFAELKRRAEACGIDPSRRASQILEAALKKPEPKIDMIVIAAMDENGAIGKGNTIPWKVPEDLKRFKERTMGHAMIMGSNTWRSFNGRALPGRHHIVVTSKPEALIDTIRKEDASRVTLVEDLDKAISLAESIARQQDQTQYFVIGGSNIYGQVVDRADAFDLTVISTQVFGADAYFPKEAVAARFMTGDLVPTITTDQTTSTSGLRYAIGIYERPERALRP